MRAPFFRSCFLALSLGFICPSQAQIFDPLASSIPTNEVSFYVQAVNQATPLLSINAERAQNPGSTIKVVTSYAALRQLGARFQWRTELFSQGVPDADGVLNQPIYLKGSGDPQLVIEKIEGLFAALRGAGVQKVNAPILIDRSAFSIAPESPASFDGAPDMPYNAQPDAALMNYRTIRLELNPSAQTINVTPNVRNYQVDSAVEWQNATCPAQGWKNTLAVAPNPTNVRVSGRYYRGCGAQQIHVHTHLIDANQHAAGVLGAAMQASQVAVAPQNERNDGWGGLLTNPLPQVQDARTPKSAKPLAYVLSNPLKDVLKDMNYFSNNVMARQIYLTLSKERYGVGSIEASSQVVSAEMAKLGLKMDTLQMGNGSGLARDTAISAAQLGQLLAKAANEPALYESLPIIGMSGTVQNRLKNTDMVGRGHIKTGSLSDVRAIAGYIDGKSGTRYAIVSIIQGASAQSEAGKKLHDAFMQWVGAQ